MSPLTSLAGCQEAIQLVHLAPAVLNSFQTDLWKLRRLTTNDGSH